MTPSPYEKLEWVEAQERQKQRWLNDHGPGTKRPWPETDIDNKRRDLAMLQSISKDYRIWIAHKERQAAS